MRSSRVHEYRSSNQIADSSARMFLLFVLRFLSALLLGFVLCHR